MLAILNLIFYITNFIKRIKICKEIDCDKSTNSITAVEVLFEIENRTDILLIRQVL